MELKKKILTSLFQDEEELPEEETKEEPEEETKEEPEE